MIKTFKCPCRVREHTVNSDDGEVWEYFLQIIKELGKYQHVTIAGGKTYIVPRIYIAKHGLRAINLSKRGFKEVQNLK